MKNITALVHSATAAIWYIVAVTIAGELSEVFKNFLKGLTDHHWVTKSISALVLFIIFYAIFSRINESPNIKKGISAVIWSAVLGTILIFGFFTLHFFFPDLFKP